MNRNSLVILLCVFIGASSCVKQTVAIKSPDAQIKLFLSTDRSSRLQYSISFRDSVVIQESDLGFELAGGIHLGQNVQITSVERLHNDEDWTPVYGERSTYRDHYNQVQVSVSAKDTKKEEFTFTIRAYNEGIAFRYGFPGEKETRIMKEETQFTFPSGSVFWTSFRAQHKIIKQSFHDIKGEIERPVLVELNENTYLAVGEAALVDFARMKFIPDPEGKHSLLSALSSEVVVRDKSVLPWRYVMLAESPAILLENNFFILNLNEPNQIEDPSWIKPGQVIREVTLSTQGGMACIDFAKANKLQYIEYDAGWYGDQYDEVTDASTISVTPQHLSGALDLQKVINYGREKGIGVILYVNQKALQNQLDDLLPLYKSWGIAGLKFGFVEVGSQQWTSWLHEAVRKAADYQMMVDIHDEYRPSGYSRTYPNLLTQEGIRGDEASPSNDMVINTIFTRMIAGAGDQTNCYFAERVGEKMGSHASQMAKAICIYSPWQFLYWYDRPQGSPGANGGFDGSEKFIPEIPDLDFFAKLPTVWDDTRVLDGYPGDHVLIARKSGDNWFVGAVNGPDNRQFTIKCDFLDEDKFYEAVVYSDDKLLRTKTNISISNSIVDCNSVISKNVLGENGMAVIISPIDP